ncbi:MAG: ABC transporter substrate-binding protein [Chloroflexi bacterium]|nr:ABC transporter substrate-binding protein [Chloroflexota bacterium]
MVEKHSNWSIGMTLVSIIAVLLVAAVFGCSQPAAPTPTPTQPPKVAPTKEAKPEAKEATPQTKAAKPDTKEATPAAPKDAKAQKEAPKAQKQLVKLTVPYGALAGSQSPLWVAKEAGLFEKYGLDVEVPYIATSTTLGQALVSGDVVLAMVGGGSVVNAVLAGADLVIVAVTSNTLGFSLYGQPEIKRVEDLKGKAAGISRIGSSTDFALRHTLEKFGLQPDKDVAIMQTGGSPESLAALKSGNVQASVFGPPTTLQARKLGLHEVVSIADLKIPYIQVGAAANRKFYASNRETVRNFLKALVEAIALAKKDKEMTMKVIGKYTATEDKEVLDDTYEFFLTKQIPRVPYVTAEAAQTILDEAAERDPKAKTTKPESFIDNSLMKELEESGFIKKLYGE